MSDIYPIRNDGRETKKIEQKQLESVLFREPESHFSARRCSWEPLVNPISNAAAATYLGFQDSHYQITDLQHTILLFPFVTVGLLCFN